MPRNELVRGTDDDGLEDMHMKIEDMDENYFFGKNDTVRVPPAPTPRQPLSLIAPASCMIRATSTV